MNTSVIPHLFTPPLLNAANTNIYLYLAPHLQSFPNALQCRSPQSSYTAQLLRTCLQCIYHKQPQVRQLLDFSPSLFNANIKRVHTLTSSSQNSSPPHTALTLPINSLSATHLLTAHTSQTTSHKSVTPHPNNSSRRQQQIYVLIQLLFPRA